MSRRRAKLISFLILLIVCVSLSIIALILFPLIVFALLIFASLTLSLFLLRYLAHMRKPFDSMPAEDGMRSTQDEQLTKYLNTLQKTSKGKKIERH